jgi:hypothetical protein
MVTVTECTAVAALPEDITCEGIVRDAVGLALNAVIEEVLRYGATVTGPARLQVERDALSGDSEDGEPWSCDLVRVTVGCTPVEVDDDGTVWA